MRQGILGASRIPQAERQGHGTGYEGVRQRPILDQLVGAIAPEAIYSMVRGILGAIKPAPGSGKNGGFDGNPAAAGGEFVIFDYLVAVAQTIDLVGGGIFHAGEIGSA